MQPEVFIETNFEFRKIKPGSHDDCVRMHACYRLVRQDFDCSQRCLILNLNIITSAWYIGHAHPATDSILAADNAVRDKWVAIDCSTAKNGRVSDANTRANLTPFTDYDIWT